MNMIKLFEKPIVLKKQHVLIFLAVLGVVYLVSHGVILSITGSNYEGVKPLFYGVEYDGRLYTAQDYGEASAHVFDTGLEFDPDGKYTGLGNIAGEETNCFLPGKSDFYPSWVSVEWINNERYIKNPVKVYKWEIKNSDGTKEVYKMEEYVLRWYVTLSYEWDSDDESGAHFLGGDVRYKNAIVWFKLNMKPFSYFEGADKVYFGIGKIVVSQVKLFSEAVVDGKIDRKTNSWIRVNPMSSGSVLPLYDMVNGQKVKEVNPYEYKGRKLNSNIFRDVVYTRIILEDFGSKVVKTGFLKKTAYGDVVTYAFDVHVFVVGEWKVKERQDVDFEKYNRTSKIEDKKYVDFPGFDIGFFGKAIITLLLILALLIITIIFFPGIVGAINAVLTAGRRR